ncbi:MAG TPA: hypothetical protein VIE69_06210 [Methylophilaceae bacterium]|jgi:hypothetical protein
MRELFLIGTNHNYQMPLNEEFKNAAEDFCCLLKGICECYSIKNLSEELSLEALRNRGREESTCQQVAKELGIRHQFCDLNSEERINLGVEDENSIRSDGWQHEWNAGRIESEVRSSHAIREQHWLDCLMKTDCWPTLFVCGANHIGAFDLLLRKSGIKVAVVAFDWSPNSSLN